MIIGHEKVLLLKREIKAAIVLSYNRRSYIVLEFETIRH